MPGVWVVITGRCGCQGWVELLGAGLAAAAVNAVALIWELAQMDFLTIRGGVIAHGFSIN